MEQKPNPKHLIVKGKSVDEMYEEIHNSNHPRHLSNDELDKKRAKFKPRIDRRT